MARYPFWDVVLFPFYVFVFGAYVTACVIVGRGIMWKR